MLMAFAMIVLGLFVVFTGPRDLWRYPVATESPYRLPWSAGVRRLCVQGNRAIVSHREWEEFAYDFAMPVGSDVCAAREGSVVLVEIESRRERRRFAEQPDRCRARRRLRWLLSPPEEVSATTSTSAIVSSRVNASPPAATLGSVCCPTFTSR